MKKLEERLVFTPGELAELFPITQHTWQRWCREGRVHAIRPFGRRPVLIPRAEVDRILGRKAVTDAV